MKRRELIEKFYGMGQTRKLRILWGALGYMSQYNGRTELECVAMATADKLRVEYEED